MKKLTAILCLLMAVLVMFSAAACAKTGGSEPSVQTQPATAYSGEALSVYTLKGPTGMGMAQMMNTWGDRYRFTVVSSPEEISAAIISGDADIAACPLNLASILYNKTGGKVQLISLNTLGVMHIVTNGVKLSSIADLKGKTIASAGQGSTPEFILNKLLLDAGLTVGKDVTVKYYSEHSEVASLAASGQADIVLLPEPNVTAVCAKNSNLSAQLDLTEQWEKAYGTKLAQGGTVVRKEIATDRYDAVLEFLGDYAVSVDYINRVSVEAAEMIVSAGIMDNAALARKSIPNSHITFITDTEMVTLAQSNLSVLYNAEPTSVGGKLPDDAFYFTPHR